MLSSRGRREGTEQTIEGLPGWTVVFPIPLWTEQTRLVSPYPIPLSTVRIGLKWRRELLETDNKEPRVRLSTQSGVSVPFPRRTLFLTGCSISGRVTQTCYLGYGVFVRRACPIISGSSVWSSELSLFSFSDSQVCSESPMYSLESTVGHPRAIVSDRNHSWMSRGLYVTKYRSAGEKFWP